MAHKKAAGSAKNLRDSNPKYRGLKLSGGQHALAGNIIVRQKGDKYIAGNNTYKGKDFTIHASVDGVVAFRKKQILRYDGRKYLKTVIDIVPAGEQPTAPAKRPTKKVSVATPKAEAKPTSSDVKEKAPKAKDSGSKDDLTAIKGLGPKAAEALHAAGISSYAGMVEAGVEGVAKILASAGGRLASTDPTMWIEEASSLS